MTQKFLTALGLPKQASKPQRTIYLYFPSAGIINGHSRIQLLVKNMLSGDWIQDFLHVSTLSTKLSLQHFQIVWISVDWVFGWESMRTESQVAVLWSRCNPLSAHHFDEDTQALLALCLNYSEVTPRACQCQGPIVLWWSLSRYVPAVTVQDWFWLNTSSKVPLRVCLFYHHGNQ